MFLKPHPNGDAPQTFMEEGRKLHRIATAALDDLYGVPSVLNLRNYQHLDPETAGKARQLDLDRITRAKDALRDLQDMGVEIFKIGDDA